MDGRYLGGEHGLNLIAWFDPLDHRQHEIHPALVRSRTLRSSVNELLGQSTQKVAGSPKGYQSSFGSRSVR